jgi:gliding motility-associated-like protein
LILLSSINSELGDSLRPNLTTTFDYDSIVWTPSEDLSCLDCLNPWIHATTNKTYTITLFNKDGCHISATITVFVSQTAAVFVPNIFSPNGDNLNDRMMIYSKEGRIKTIDQFVIYDRWGEIIYSESGTNLDDGSHRGWDGYFDGQKVIPGVYVYQIGITLVNNKTQMLAGSVTLLD